MKKSALFLLFACALIINLTSCGKYEEGPSFSLVSKKNRITNTWNLTEQTTNGQTDDLSNFTWQVNIKEDDTYTSTASYWNIPLINESGSWRFSDDKLNLLTTPNGSANTASWEILRLTKDEFKIRWINNGDTLVSSFISMN